jgi:multisubunit Na+/H+ antiporter MnhE subunit
MVLGGLLTFGLLLGVWIALAGQPDTQDLVAGSATAVVAVAIGFSVSRQGRALPGFRWTDVGMLVALPGQLVVETWRVFVAAARKLAGKDVAGSWSTVAVDTGTESGGWRAARRDAVLTALMSASPNTIVVDIDADAGTALIHRMVRATDHGSSLPDVSGRGAKRGR